jgi:hypothetical protein
MAWPSPHFSLRNCDDTIATVVERFEHATRIGARREPEMYFECLPCDCTLREANRWWQPEIDSASIGWYASGKFQHVHHIPRQFIGDLLASCRLLSNLPDQASWPTVPDWIVNSAGMLHAALYRLSQCTERLSSAIDPLSPEPV